MDYNLSTTWTVVLIIWAMWELAWKGVALWEAGRNDQLGWFVVLLLINSFGVLPIIYLLMHHWNTDEKKGYSHEKALPI